MSDEDWNAGFAKSNAVYLNGKALPDPDPRGERIEDDTFLILFNAHHEPIRFVLPGLEWGPSWRTVIDTYEDVVLEWGPIHRAGAGIEAASRSVMLLHLVE